MKILIMLSTYNGDKFIVEQLDSIRRQKGEGISLLIRDDGSSDSTLDLIYSYKAKYPSFEIEVIEGENCGSTKSFTKMLQVVANMYDDGRRFDYYAFADQDDIWLENKLCEAISKLQNHDCSKPLVYCSNTFLYYNDFNDAQLMRPKGSVSISKSKALIHNLGTGCTMVFNYDAIKYYNMHPVEKIWMHDYLIYMIGVYLGSAIYDDNAYIYYRQHANNQFGASGSFATRMYRWLKMYIFNNNHHNEFMCANFADAYMPYFSSDDLHTLNKIVKYRRSWRRRVNLMLDKSIRFNSFFVDMRLVVRILIGRL